MEYQYFAVLHHHLQPNLGLIFAFVYKNTGGITKLSVMSFNIRFGTANDGKNNWHLRRPLVSQLLRHYFCDIVSLQEALHFQLNEILNDLPSLGVSGVGREDGNTRGEHTAILYNKARFELLESATFWFSETPDIAGSRHWGNSVPRICTWALLKDLFKNTAFYVYNVHLDHKSSYSRQKSSELLIRKICNRKLDAPVIVTGDFNTIESNEIIRYFKGICCLKSILSNAFPMSDTYRVIHPRALGGTLNLFRGIRYGPRIDYIFSDHRFKVLSAEIIRTHYDKRYPSDHFPIKASLQTGRK
jgi:endonuclease/exonuclease/phosphatase family metal-dependent hydrolase